MKVARLLALLWLLSGAGWAQVALLRSEPTFQALGWRARWEWEGARWALEQLGAQPTVVTPADLEAGNLTDRVLVLPDVRNMEPATVQAVQAFAAGGGKLLATYMTSYRQADNRSWVPNDLALGPLLGVHFQRWAGGSGEAGVMGGVPLPRHQAMLVEPAAGAEVLARWDQPAGAAAVVLTYSSPLPSPHRGEPVTVYLGEDLFAPECCASPQVMAMLADLLRRLDPALKLKVPQGPLRPPAPELPFTPLAEAGERVRVGLGSLPVREVRLQASQGLKSQAGAGSELVVQVLGDHLQVGSQSYPRLRVEGAPYLELLQLFPNQCFRWGAYRGTLELTPGPGGLQLVNELSLDGYLAGVVPSEVPPSFPEESLKAMAVVARGFALSHKKRHGAFDLCSEVHCQVYRALPGESPATTAAIQATSGQYLAFQGRPADATFSACCGGCGEEVHAAWPRSSPVSYLAGGSDLCQGPPPNLTQEAVLRAFLDQPAGGAAQPPSAMEVAFCASAGRFRWEENYPWATLTARLHQSVAQVGPVQSLEVVSRDASGRVAELRITGAQGSCSVLGDSIRWLFSGGRVGAGGLNSTLFYLDVVGEGDQRVLHLRGGGWGHGVGLCQEGAAGRARAGQLYGEILEHYYPGTQLVGAPALGGPPGP